MVEVRQTTSELDAAIAAARESTSGAAKHLGERANAIFGAVSAQAVDEVRRRVDNLVLGQPRHTAALDDKRLARLRADIAGLLRTLPGATMKQLAAEFRWTFPQEPEWVGDADQGPMYHGAAQPPTLVVDVIRTAVGGAARIVGGAGYQLHPASHWVARADGVVERYIGPIEPSPRLIVALRGYADARLRYFRKLRAVHRLEADRTALERRVDAEVERDEVMQATRARWARTATEATTDS